MVALITLVLTARQHRVTAAAGPVASDTSAAGEGGGAPPDLSTMTPRERFDSLYNRVMRSAERGDTATVARFSPMALLAYGQLDTVDADGHYHMAVLQLHVHGDTASALRLADSILARSPQHLLGYVIRGTAAQLAGNQRMLQRSYVGLLGAWDAEMKVGRPEYRDHQAMLDQFHAAAGAARSGKQ